jgi:hypothetical protein
MIGVQVQHYLGRARDFLKGMELLQNDLGEYRYSSALLGIHGALSYCDALRIGLGGESLSSDDHQVAPRELKSLLASRKYEQPEGVDRLEKLLAQKSMIAYFPKRVGERDIVTIIQQARRFALWAEGVGKELSIEGW